MSNIPSINEPVQIEGARFRSPVSESIIQQLGGNINYLLSRQLQIVEFNTVGTTAWTVPDGVSFLMLFGCGGGGGGAGAKGYDLGGFTPYLTGGAGGSAALPVWIGKSVSPLAIIPVTIGGGGVGGAAGANGGDGANTTFGGVTFFGAPGAVISNWNVGPTAGNPYNQPGVEGVVISSNPLVPDKNTYASWALDGISPVNGALLSRGGQTANKVATLRPPKPNVFTTVVASNGGGGTLAYAGGGGGTGLGPGGNGGNGTGTPSVGSNAPSTSYGAGGGGGGTSSAGSGRGGGNGAGGYLAIVYFGGV